MNTKTKVILNTRQFFRRVSECVRKAIQPALKSARWLLSLMIPVSLGVTILQFLGVIAWISGFINPVFELLGVSGEGAFVFITSIFLNIYSAIAVIATFSLNMREITILALMCLISHNLIIETIVQKKTGSSAIKMVLVRLLSSIFAAVLLNWILPADLSTVIYQNTAIHHSSTFLQVLTNWGISTFFLAIKVIVFVTSLMILQKVLEEFGILSLMSKGFAPLLKIMGLPAKTSFLWIVANVVGLAYGSAIMIEEFNKGKITNKEADTLNHHVAVSHSMLEDTLLFAAIGVPVFFITIPRIFIAMLVVWGYKLQVAVSNFRTKA